MAAPTAVFVESNSISTATLRWTYAGSASISVWRSTDGVTYAEATSTALGDRVLAGTTTYINTGLVAATRYWYKLSDDAGSTFSSVVTVVTQTCPGGMGGDNELSLPRFSDEVNATIDLNNMAERIEQVLIGRVLNPGECIVCPTNGAVVIDCSDGCQKFLIVADEDINSISINGCNEAPLEIEVILPANTTRQICGFPSGFGFGGDECQQMPWVTGSTGGSINVTGGNSPSTSRGRPSYNRPTGGGAGGGGGGGAGCTCTPINGGLTIKSCNANNSLNCSTTKELKLIVCGGKGPYNWSRTGSVSLKGAASPAAAATATGTNITVTPPANAGSAVAGDAYTVVCKGCSVCVGGTCTTIDAANAYFKCDDTSTGVFQGPGTGTACTPDGLSTTPSDYNSCCPSGNCAAATATTCPSGRSESCDLRTAPMIAAGCAPCGLNAGATVSVTDANGVVATIILKA